MDAVTFISHKQEDGAKAEEIARRLKNNHSIQCYLDTLDDNVSSGPTLADYLKEKMRKCNNLLAVVSNATKGSWWVPWEIGVASERNYPLATYAIHPSELPSYLKKWPYLTSDSDLDKYAKEVKYALLGESYLTETASVKTLRKSVPDDFFVRLNRELGR